MGSKHYARTMDGNGNFIGNWTKGHLCHTLAKNLSVFCLYPGLSGRGNFKAAPHIAVAWVLLLARFEESIGDEGQNREIKKQTCNLIRKEVQVRFWPRRR